MLSPFWCFHLFISVRAARLEAMGSGLCPGRCHHPEAPPGPQPPSARPVGPAWKLNVELAGSCLLLAVRIQIKLPPLSHLSSCPCLGVAESKAPPGHTIPAFIAGQGTAGGLGMGTTGSAFPLPFSGPKPRSLKPFLSPDPKAG